MMMDVTFNSLRSVINKYVTTQERNFRPPGFLRYAEFEVKVFSIY
jgi:hypothetical protein